MVKEINQKVYITKKWKQIFKTPDKTLNDKGKISTSLSVKA